jgi:hypothetical protein
MMPNLKLARLPDRVPVKVMLNLTPDLHRALNEYAALYVEAYGEQARVNELIPAMLVSFLEGDRGFTATRIRRSRAQSLDRSSGA